MLQKLPTAKQISTIFLQWQSHWLCFKSQATASKPNKSIMYSCVFGVSKWLRRFWYIVHLHQVLLAVDSSRSGYHQTCNESEFKSRECRDWAIVRQPARSNPCFPRAPDKITLARRACLSWTTPYAAFIVWPLQNYECRPVGPDLYAVLLLHSAICRLEQGLVGWLEFNGAFNTM